MLYNYEKFNDNQKRNISFNDYALLLIDLLNERTNKKEIIYDDTEYQYYFDLDKIEVTKFRIMKNKYDIGDVNSTDWKPAKKWLGESLTRDAIYNLLLFNKNEATHGFFMY